MKRRFTLIELLCVIAVILIIAAFLMPSFQRARAQVKIAVCCNNYAQLSRLCTAYAVNNKNNLPILTRAWNWGEECVEISGIYRGPGLLYSGGYADGKSLNKLMICPSAKNDLSAWTPSMDITTPVPASTYYHGYPLLYRGQNASGITTMSDGKRAFIGDQFCQVWGVPQPHRMKGLAGPVIGYKDGHVAQFRDETMLLFSLCTPPAWVNMWFGSDPAWSYIDSQP